MIINELALIVNNFIISCFSSGIEFYVILIAMFIFNFIIYIICSFLKEAGKVRFE